MAEHDITKPTQRGKIKVGQKNLFGKSMTAPTKENALIRVISDSRINKSGLKSINRAGRKLMKEGMTLFEVNAIIAEKVSNPKLKSYPRYALRKEAQTNYRWDKEVTQEHIESYILAERLFALAEDIKGVAPNFDSLLNVCKGVLKNFSFEQADWSITKSILEGNAAFGVQNITSIKSIITIYGEEFNKVKHDRKMIQREIEETNRRAMETEDKPVFIPQTRQLTKRDLEEIEELKGKNAD